MAFEPRIALRTSDNLQHELRRSIEYPTWGSRSCWIVTWPSRVIQRESTTSASDMSLCQRCPSTQARRTVPFRWTLTRENLPDNRQPLGAQVFPPEGAQRWECGLPHIDVHRIAPVGGSAEALTNDVAFPAGSELSQSNPGGFKSMPGVFLSGFNA